ncbi:hypothetical protein BC937DRAFT_91511, partial [Endogone sp. FLAS-F59071]
FASPFPTPCLSAPYKRTKESHLSVNHQLIYHNQEKSKSSCLAKLVSAPLASVSNNHSSRNNSPPRSSARLQPPNQAMEDSAPHRQLAPLANQPPPQAHLVSLPQRHRLLVLPLLQVCVNY